MNTKQKAEAWLAFLGEITPTKHEQLGAEIITALLKERDALINAGGALYMAGRWSCDQPVDEARLWENMRDALNLPRGTETYRKATALCEEPKSKGQNNATIPD